MKSKIVIITIILFFFVNFIYAQKETEIILKDTTSECDIYVQSRVLIKDAEITGVKDSTLYFLKNDVPKELNVLEIRKIKFNATGGFWKGAAWAAGINAAFFLTLAAIVPPNEGEWKGINKLVFLAFGTIGSIPVGLIGGFIGAITQEDKIYHLPKGDLKSKIRQIRQIIKENK